MNAPSANWRQEALLLLGLLALVLAWDASSGDLWVARQLGHAGGFSARHSLWARDVLHDGARWASGLALLWLSWDAWRPGARAHGPSAHGPSAQARRRAWWACLLALCLVPALKHLSATSCPWSLSEFGGSAAWVSHWRWGVGDGGPGHCFPSGHAAGSFAFASLLWAWAPWRRQRPWPFALALALVLGGGTATSVAQWARGAHYVSHSLWTAWLCALLTWVVVRWAFPQHAHCAPSKPRSTREHHALRPER